MSLPPEEQRFFHRMHWIRMSIHLATVAAVVYHLRTPATVLDWVLFVVILFCLDRLVSVTVETVGYWFWCKAFGRKYS